VRAALASYHARVRVELEQFGGTVEKFIGDAIALFQRVGATAYLARAEALLQATA
jgi:class 3 adenylate cyclase